MTIQDYRTAGYDISNSINQAYIDKAEIDVFNSYVVGIIGANANIGDYENEVMALSFCLLLRRSISKTRFGADKKSSQFATAAEDDALISQCFNIGFPAIQSLKSKSVLTTYKFTDIANVGAYIY